MLYIVHIPNIYSVGYDALRQSAYTTGVSILLDAFTPPNTFFDL